MATIGLRSGKVKAGLYHCNGYAIERQPTDYWHVIKDGSLLRQFRIMTEAYEWCRYPLMREEAISMNRSSSPLRHLDLSDDKIAADIASEKARQLINAYDRIENLQDAVRGLLGLLQLLANNTDIPEGVRDSIWTNHRVFDAQELLL